MGKFNISSSKNCTEMGNRLLSSCVLQYMIELVCSLLGGIVQLGNKEILKSFWIGISVLNNHTKPCLCFTHFHYYSYNHARSIIIIIIEAVRNLESNLLG